MFPPGLAVFARSTERCVFLTSPLTFLLSDCVFRLLSFMARLPFALAHQPFDRHTVIQRIAWNNPGRGIDGLACLPVTALQSFDAAGGRQLGMFFDEATIGPAEADIVIGSPLDAEPVFVHQPVVTAALCRLLDYAAWMGWSR